MKGFATSLAIVLSFCAGIVLFDFHVTASFLVGTCMVVASTYLYNSPDAATRRGGAEGTLPTSLPSPSLAKGPYNPPLMSHSHHHGRTDSNGSASSSMGATSLHHHHHHPAAAPLAQHPHASAMRISTGSTSSASTSASSSHRRPNPQSIPPGAQTPDHTVSNVFPLTALPSSRRASEDAAQVPLGPDAAQAPLVPLAGEAAVARQAAAELGGGGGEGYSSGRTTAPGSPDPAMRSRSPLPNNSRWS